MSEFSLTVSMATLMVNLTNPDFRRLKQKKSTMQIDAAMHEAVPAIAAVAIVRLPDMQGLDV